MPHRHPAIPQVPAEALARNPRMTLSDPAMKPTMDAIRKRIVEDPAYGRRLMREAGILDGKGKLTKPFGG